MLEQWNKYAPTAARRHGRPGRELRPRTVTIVDHDINEMDRKDIFEG